MGSLTLSKEWMRGGVGREGKTERGEGERTGTDMQNKIVFKIEKNKNFKNIMYFSYP